MNIRIAIADTDIDVVRGVSFHVGPGEVFGLVGESAAGRPPLLLFCSGTPIRGLEIASGEVLLGDLDILRIPQHQQQALRGAQISYVPQDPASALNPALKVGLQLRETLASHAPGWRTSTGLRSHRGSLGRSAA